MPCSLSDVTFTQRRILRFTGTEPKQIVDRLADEEPLELRIGSTPIAVVMRTPGADEDLASGFVLTEGIMAGPEELESIEYVGENRLRLTPASGVEIDPEQFRRNLYTTSSCGVCGKASIDAVRIAISATGRSVEPVDAAVFATLPGLMREAQELFGHTGGLHAAALFTTRGELLGIREDVGRHNAVDKVVGAMARHRWPLQDTILMISGRISFEIVQKAAVAGIMTVAGVSAATSLAADLAGELGMTLIGFLRGDGFNLYAGNVG